MEHHVTIFGKYQILWKYYREREKAHESEKNQLGLRLQAVQTELLNANASKKREEQEFKLYKSRKLSQIFV